MAGGRARAIGEIVVFIGVVTLCLASIPLACFAWAEGLSFLGAFWIVGGLANYALLRMHFWSGVATFWVLALLGSAQVEGIAWPLALALLTPLILVSGGTGLPFKLLVQRFPDAVVKGAPMRRPRRFRWRDHCTSRGVPASAQGDAKH